VSIIAAARSKSGPRDISEQFTLGDAPVDITECSRYDAALRDTLTLAEEPGSRNQNWGDGGGELRTGDSGCESELGAQEGRDRDGVEVAGRGAG
jgi:hypothetical protein